MRLTALIACALLAAASAASAQDTDPAARWAAINKAVPRPTALAVDAAVAAAQADCVSTSPEFGPIEPVTAWRRIDESIRTGQIANAWSVTVRRPDCPPDQAYGRFVIFQSPDGTLAAQMLHPGRSHADPDELNDGVMARAMRTAANTAARDIPGCSSAWITASGRLIRTDIVDDSKIGPGRYGLYDGQWRESWLFGLCDRQLSVFVDFTGGPDGVTAVASSWASLKR